MLAPVFPGEVTHKACDGNIPHRADKARFHGLLDPLVEILSDVARWEGFLWYRFP